MVRNSLKKILLQILLIICLTELAVAVLFTLLPVSMSPFAVAIAHAAILSVAAMPFIYLLAIKPFVQARDEAMAKISRMAYRDPLTDLPNRRYLSLSLEKYIAGNVRHRINGALILLDLDGFKEINDKYGHVAGDKVLCEVAERLKKGTRLEDTVVRLGGDEFTVLINHLHPDSEKAQTEIQSIAEQLRARICVPVEYKGKEIPVGCSVGITMLAAHSAIEDMIRDADLAMYQAKKDSDDGIVIMGSAA